MKQTLNMKRQLAISLRYCYSVRRDTQNMSAIRNFPTIAKVICNNEKAEVRKSSCLRGILINGRHQKKSIPTKLLSISEHNKCL